MANTELSMRYSDGCSTVWRAAHGSRRALWLSTGKRHMAAYVHRKELLVTVMRRATPCALEKGERRDRYRTCDRRVISSDHGAIILAALGPS